MVPRGLLIPTKEGYEVYLRHYVNQDIDISTREEGRELTPRQRFTLAHEIAHTLYFQKSGSVPVPDPAISNELTLESICDRTAGQILLPTHLLKLEIHHHGKIDSDLVISLARKFRASLSVAIERLSITEGASPTRRCILLVRKFQKNAEIKKVYFGAGFLPILPAPAKNTCVTDWLSDFPLSVISDQVGGEYEILRKNVSIRFSQTVLRSPDFSLIQISA
jgi:IrrE N-terminal-like domain